MRRRGGRGRRCVLRRRRDRVPELIRRKRKRFA
jgi:hypothetical protein